MNSNRVMQVRTPGGPLELVERPIPEPPAGHVRIRVQACGICHSDSLTVENHWPGITFPRVPGHEIAGVVDALGADVTTFALGDRVGMGWHGGHDGTCDSCRRGDFITCGALQIPGITFDGGYADYAIAPIGALARIPAELSAAEASSLMCAGVTTYNALRHSGAKPGDLVAILGIGGLGHLAVQYAHAMGFATVAIARGADKGPLATSLGAKHYIDSTSQNVAEELQKLGGAKLVLATVTDAGAMAATIGGLGIDGKLLVVGVSMDPIPVPPIALIGARRSVAGWPSGVAPDSEDTMAFSVLADVRAQIETMPLERAQEAYEKMMSGKARFRMVLVTE
jgi:D-arabinose 1-dehydrogenase-like Zn-dependent alcohol dehydrogenase